MLEITGDIWKFHKAGYPICITTNGIVSGNGKNIMGKGIALQAKEKFPEFPKLLGDHIKKYGNVVGYFEEQNLISLPTKNHWMDRSPLFLIEKSLIQLVNLADERNFKFVYLVRPGCSNGQLDWKCQVKPLVQKVLVDERFIVVQN